MTYKTLTDQEFMTKIDENIELFINSKDLIIELKNRLIKSNEDKETYKTQLQRLWNEKSPTDGIDESYDECCDMCDCYHGHHPWCEYSDEYRKF